MSSFTSTEKTVLKIIAINDVYEIDNLPYFATCKRLEVERTSDAADRVIAVLPGDFVAPSLLSSIDKGYGMIDCLNASGMDYVSIGNHENDIPLNQLHNRIKQSKFTWINSNMPDLPLGTLQTLLPEYSIICVKDKRIALLGLNTEDRSILNANAFGGCSILPIMQQVKLLHEQLTSQSIDLVIPLTHQLMPQDRSLAIELNKEGEPVKIPLIVGGHDHEVYNEIVNNCQIIKTGADAKNIAIITITWDESSPSSSPTIVTELKACKDYCPDPTVAALVAQHKSILVDLEKSCLCKIPSHSKFSSKEMRLHPTSVGKFICTTIKKALDVEIVMVCAGSIRGNRDYIDEDSFSYAHLKSEIPFETSIITVNLPGHVINDMIAFSRAPALEPVPVEKGGYIQTDDSVWWDKRKNQLLKLNNKELKPERMYFCAINEGMLAGLDNIAPLLQWKADNIHLYPCLLKTAEAGVGAKQLIVSHFSRLLLLSILQVHNFSDIDTDNDDRITKTELTNFIQSNVTASKSTEIDSSAASGNSKMTSMLIDNLFMIADANNDGYITKSEIADLSIASISRLTFHDDDMSTIIAKEAVDAELIRILGVGYDSSIRETVFATLDDNKDNAITKRELLEVANQKLQKLGGSVSI